MTIEAKYTFGEKVWCKIKSKPYECTIGSISLYPGVIDYLMEYRDDEGKIKIIALPERLCFKTQKEAS